MAAPLSYEKTTRLIARALGLTVDQLSDAFRPAGPADLPPLLALRRRLIGDQLHWDDEAYLRWRYHFGDPARGRGECWVLAPPSGVLGMLGSERFVLSHPQGQTEALSVMDIAMVPEAEGFGLGAWMSMHLCRHAPCVVALGSNGKSRGIVSQVLTRQPDRRRHAHFISVRALLARRVRPHALGGALAACADAVLAGLRRLLLPKPPRGIVLRRIERFDDAHTSPLIEQAHGSNEITPLRDVAALNWRLFDIPRSRYDVWGAYEGDRLLGYVASQVRGTTSARVGRLCEIEDVLIDERHRARVLPALVARVIGEAARARCERVSMIACHAPTEAVLRRLAFMPHGDEFETLSAATCDPGLQAAMDAGVPWHLTGLHADRDA